MATITVTNYGLFLESLLEGRLNLLGDELWCMLVTAEYSFHQHTHKFKSGVTGELIASGYSAGGQKVTNSGTEYDSASRTVSVPAGNLSWPAITCNDLVGAVVYGKPVNTPENAMPLISYISFGETVTRNVEAFYVNWPATGVLRLVTP